MSSTDVGALPRAPQVRVGLDVGGTTVHGVLVVDGPVGAAAVA